MLTVQPVRIVRQEPAKFQLVVAQSTRIVPPARSATLGLARPLLLVQIAQTVHQARAVSLEFVRAKPALVIPAQTVLLAKLALLVFVRSQLIAAMFPLTVPLVRPVSPEHARQLRPVLQARPAQQVRAASLEYVRPQPILAILPQIVLLVKLVSPEHVKPLLAPVILQQTALPARPVLREPAKHQLILALRA